MENIDNTCSLSFMIQGFSSFQPSTKNKFNCHIFQQAFACRQPKLIWYTINDQIDDTSLIHKYDVRTHIIPLGKHCWRPDMTKLAIIPVHDPSRQDEHHDAIIQYELYSPSWLNLFKHILQLHECYWYLVVESLFK